MRLTTPVPERRLLRIKGRALADGEKRLSARVQAYLDGQPAETEAADLSSDCDGDDERRRFSRVDLAAEVLVRRVGGLNFQVAIRDISSGGCKIELLEPCEVGDPVITRLPQLEPLGSRVCWSEGTTAGVQFLTVIHPAVLESLLARLPGSEVAPG